MPHILDNRQTANSLKARAANFLYAINRPVAGDPTHEADHERRGGLGAHLLAQVPLVLWPSRPVRPAATFSESLPSPYECLFAVVV